MTCPEEILKLVRRFDDNREAYKSGKYNEAQLRNEFINPFFIALGWDVYNIGDDAEAYKDVIHEDAIKVGGATKAPDYSFRIGGTRKFFVETKRPSVDLKHDISPAFQLRRYAWSAKLPLSILTDFEEFAVYDCRVKPHKNDKASTARIRYFTYDRYPEEWDNIFSVFSREAIKKGSFDKYAQSRRKRGTAEVDDAFLKEIEHWREMLARNIALRNRKLTTRQLNFAVQRTIDRIIFLRICEDRGIEQQNRLQSLLNGSHVYKRLFEMFHRADERYNSGLFHFQKEKDRATPPDDLTPGLKIDDKVLKEIIKNLYYPDSPYEFSVLPADILGQVYEQFLGQVIRLTKGHQAKVEPKPEVKKAGGVYYTPTYIVSYIVKNTVGKLLEKKTPKQASKLRILDPACGSGSFLIGAYQYLLDYHLKWYSKHDPKKHARGRNPKLYQAQGGDWRLTTSERKRILLNNIYGVDIDPQAVEVTKLSLLLKVLEGETKETVERNLLFWRKRALPDLSSNIKCGNSLIGYDYQEGKTIDMFDDEERYRINPFDWHAEFPEIFRRKNPGFDAVIGNPPYINMLQLDRTLIPAMKPYWKRKYQSAAGAFDIYVLFVEQGIGLLRKDGYLSYIIPNKFLAAEYAQEFRKWTLTNCQFISMLDFSRVKVWSASVYPVVPVFRKSRFDRRTKIAVSVASVPGLHDIRILPAVPCGRLEKIPDNIWSFITQKGAEVLLKALACSSPLQEIAEVWGASTVAEGAEYPALLIDHGSRHHGQNTARFVVSGSVRRYTTSWLTVPVQFSHRKYSRPLIRLESPMPIRRIEQARSRKIIICKVAPMPRAFLDTEGKYVGAYTTYVLERGVSLAFITAVLNSRLMNFLYHSLYDALAMRGGALRFQPPQVRRLPIRTVNLSDPMDKSRHDRMVELVELMLKLHKDLAKAKTEHEKTLLQRQIDATDRQIDQLVYELYGLTEKEVKIVEEAT